MVNSAGGVVHTISFVREPMVDWVVRAGTQMAGQVWQQSRCSSLLQDSVHGVSDGTLIFWKQTGTGLDQIKLPGGASVITGCSAGTRTLWLSRDAASEDRGTFCRGTETMGL